MAEPEAFIPPNPNEPIPAPRGASDAGLPGELSPNQEPLPDFDPNQIAEVELMLATADLVDRATAGAPTVVQALTLAAAQIRKNWGPPENINKFTIWFYGKRLAAAWCYIFLSWVLAHAAKTEAAGLAAMGGKHAYVPDILHETGGSVKVGHTDLRPGDFVAMEGYDHVEIVEKILSSTQVQTIGGNTVNGSSDDAVKRSTRPRSIINARFRPSYAVTPAPAPTPASTADDDCWVA
jgi:hypothetical protein